MADSRTVEPMSSFMDGDIERILSDGPVGHLRLPSVDRMLGGLRDRLTVIASKPGTGKTTLLGGILDDAAADGLPCVFFEIEMTRRALLARSLVRMSGGALSMADLDGPLGPEAEGALRRAAERYGEEVAPRMYIMDGPLDISSISRRVSTVADAHGTAPVVGLDYIQLVSLPQGLHPGDERTAIRLIFTELQRVVSDYGSPVFAISSINRTGYSRASVGLDNLGGCSYIEYGADAVLGLTGKGKGEDGPGSPSPRPVVLATLKNRYGPQDETELAFDAVHATFTEPEAGR